jgi:hypothetical protein
MPSPKALASRLPSQTVRQRSSSRRRSKLNVFLQGLQVLDGRSPAVRQYAAARRELVDQLGGPENISAAQRFLIEMTVRGLIYLNHLDAHLLQQKSLILVAGKTRKSKDRKSQLLLLERMHISNIVSKQLSLLGLERKTRMRSLTEDLAKALPAGEKED